MLVPAADAIQEEGFEVVMAAADQVPQIDAFNQVRHTIIEFSG